MEKLKTLIDKKDYKAASDYLKNNHELTNPIKDFNLGFISYAQGDYALARYFFEVAGASGMKSNEVRDSLEIVKKDLNIYQLEKEYTVKDEIVLSSLSYEKEVGFSIIALFFVLLLISFVKVKNLCISFFAICVLVLGGYSFYLTDLKLQINLAENLVYEGASKALEPVGEILVGQKLAITEKKKNWVYINYPENLRGWVYKHEAKDL